MVRLRLQETKEAAVDFIERWLHISPDGGSGTLEIVIYLVPFVLVVAYRLGVRGRRRP